MTRGVPRGCPPVAGPTGNLALIETRWLPEGDTTTAQEALAGHPATVTATAVGRGNLDTGAPERGIRLWDAASPAIRAFDTIDAFPFDPAWVVEATFTPVAGEHTVPFEHIRDNGLTRDKVVPGDISFSRDGVDYTLSAFDDEGTLLLVFGDPTNGAEDDGGTYASGRFLFVTRHGDRAVLDFNRAFVPPCGFSDQFNCPLPPRSNRFAFPVTAGEKRVVFREGFAH
ncbi:hypothetical protein O159_22290 [Leifsonia xyli subsp. cynodontis DSM 46306]|uniref:DUF1684 domain-containing protein n=1 Tax=Leifsonia xyli subsp. cynodontis DSM 46306 TaxID=1389489 RepID=U3P7B8_LEIXC|nr:DUF1684 domain-containing protein [Leifsonia xyli]AGW42200.1 hypothetical protein O159_22290 [Leifsonia xyli subsp. cynodontis DSM 46306]